MKVLKEENPVINVRLAIFALLPWVSTTGI
jgi:hypothetical protein